MRIDTSKLSIKEIYEQRQAIMDTKKLLPIKSDPMAATAPKGVKPKMKTKAFGESSDPNKMKVTFVGNTALWCDSHMDVLAVGCYEKTVAERGKLVPHLVDHDHSLRAKLGKTLDVFTKIVNVSEFGVESDVQTTESLMMTSELIRKWDEKVFEMYKDEGVDQHSIGMQYVRLGLAINDEEYKEEFELWQKVYPQIINKEFVDKRDYFWYVTEIKLFEISAVLFGSNELTPTTETEKNIHAPFVKNTHEEEGRSSAVTEDTLDEEYKRKQQLLND